MVPSAGEIITTCLAFRLSPDLLSIVAASKHQGQNQIKVADQVWIQEVGKGAEVVE